MREKISQAQTNLLEKSKAFLRKRDMRPARQAVTDPENYLSVWAPGSLGNLRVQCLHQARWISKSLVIAYLRNLINLGREGDVVLDRVDPSFKYERIAISWCVESDFLPDGDVRSRYFNCTTDDLDGVLWIMLPLDGKTLKNKKANVIFLNRNKPEGFSLTGFLKNAFFCLTRNVSFTPDGLFAQKFADEIVTKVNIQSALALLMPYEGQPWQHTVFLNVKKQNKNIHILGDLHSCLPPLPTDFIKRCGAPDTFFLHGAGQKDIAVQSLGWDKGDIKVVPSLRFGKDNSVDIRSKILLPYSFHDASLILSQLDSFFKNFSDAVPDLDIRNHPAQSESAPHRALIAGIQELQAKYKNNNNAPTSDKDVVLVVGSSSAIIECLERGMTVFQVTEDPVFESYSPEIWAGLNVEYLDDNIIKYSTKGNPAYLEFGKSDIQMMFENA